jgi:hypothetical protein
MQRLYSTAALLIFGLATPLLAQTIAPMAVVAGNNNPDGSFSDREWYVTIQYQNNSYQYRGQRIGSNKSIQLSGATVSRDGQRKIYTWNNNGTRYQAIWKPQDPEYIRLRVTTPSGKEVLNRLLRASEDGC